MGRGSKPNPQAEEKSASGGRKEGLEELRKRIEEHPGDSRAWYHMGFALLGQKRYAEALRALDRAAELDPRRPHRGG